MRAAWVTGTANLAVARSLSKTRGACWTLPLPGCCARPKARPCLWVFRHNVRELRPPQSWLQTGST